MALESFVRTWGTVPIEIGKNLALSLPLVARLARLRHKTGMMDADQAVEGTFEFIARHVPMKDKELLEIGPGHTVKLLRRALDVGARRARALDVVAYVNPPPGIDVILYDGREFPIESASVDGLWSWDCFEHLRHPAITVAECGRVLRTGGMMVVDIDIRDHRTLDEARGIESLAYPDWLWNAMMWQRSAYTNRVRYSEWLALFEKAGLEPVLLQPAVSRTLKDLHGRDRLSSRWSSDDYAITSFRAVLSKR